MRLRSCSCSPKIDHRSGHPWVPRKSQGFSVSLPCANFFSMTEDLLPTNDAEEGTNGRLYSQIWTMFSYESFETLLSWATKGVLCARRDTQGVLNQKAGVFSC
mmetsp:Transcript_16823/g.38858  ORF Transcript_16823/g.38858 Transcript_16823/m.38858 type:complete len:103 (+) Transcript_16823:818-1126(+)